MSAQYKLPVWDTLSTAWKNISGAKRSFWASLGLLFVISFGIGILKGLTEDITALSTLFAITGNVVAYLLQLGIIYMGITRAIDQPINYKMVFYTFNLQLMLMIIGLYILMIVLFTIPVIIAGAGVILIGMNNMVTMIPGIILVAAASIGGIALMVRISLSAAFVLDTGASPLTAIKHSIKVTGGNFWRLVGVFLMQSLIVAICALPLFIGLIWAIPFSFICYGTVYQRLRTNL